MGSRWSSTLNARCSGSSATALRYVRVICEEKFYRKGFINNRPSWVSNGGMRAIYSKLKLKDRVWVVGTASGIARESANRDMESVGGLETKCPTDEGNRWNRWNLSSKAHKIVLTCLESGSKSVKDGNGLLNRSSSSLLSPSSSPSSSSLPSSSLTSPSSPSLSPKDPRQY